MQPDRTSGNGADDTTAIPYADRSTPRPDEHGGGGGITRHDVATIVAKLIGVYMLLQGFPTVASIGQYGFGGLGRIPIYLWLYYLTLAGFYLGIGALLIAFGDRAAKWLLPKPNGLPSVPPAPGSPVELQAAAFAVAGVIIMVFWAVPWIVFDTWRYLLRHSPDAPPGQIVDIVPFLVRHLLELALGIWLFYGSKRLSLYWQSLRGQRPGPEEGPL